MLDLRDAKEMLVQVKKQIYTYAFHEINPCGCIESTLIKAIVKDSLSHPRIRYIGWHIVKHQVEAIVIEPMIDN